MKHKKYEAALEPLQAELENLARWLQHKGKSILVVLEGRDTSGKGGVINAITERLNPRQVKVAALSKPSDAERTQWYYQRYIAHLPSAGEMVLFDRSWYNRAGVEKVMGFCSNEEYELFLAQTPVFERLLVDSGIILLKYWLAVDQKEQEERFRERADDEMKRWKLSPIDLKARDYYVEYGRARDKMFEATHTKHAPWFVVEFDDQKRGRLNLISHLLDQVPDKKVPVEPLVLPPLKGKLHKEKYRGPVTPIKNKY